MQAAAHNAQHQITSVQINFAFLLQYLRFFNFSPNVLLLSGISVNLRKILLVSEK